MGLVFDIKSMPKSISHLGGISGKSGKSSGKTSGKSFTMDRLYITRLGRKVVDPHNIIETSLRNHVTTFYTRNNSTSKD